MILPSPDSHPETPVPVAVPDPMPPADTQRYAVVVGEGNGDLALSLP